MGVTAGVSVAAAVAGGAVTALVAAKVTRKMGLDKWQPVIDVNLTGTFLTIRDAAEAMVNGAWPGLLVAISSVIN